MKRILTAFFAVLICLPCLAFFACGTRTFPEDDRNNGVIAPETTPENAEEPDPSEEPDPPEEILYVANTDETLPSVKIKTNDGNDITGNKDWAEYKDCTVTVTDCADEYKLDEVAAQVKVRGNYTANYEKKPLRIKYNKKQKMLGLNDDAKAKSWVLLAEYKDSSMMRNATAFFLGKSILSREGYYCSDFRYVEVYVNDDYRGMYLLAEQQQVNENRVDVAEPDDGYEGTDIGYFVEMDGYYDEEVDLEKFTVDYGKNLKYKNGETASGFQQGYAIKNDVYSAAQRDFIAKSVKNIFDVVYDAVYNEHNNLSTNPYYTLDADNNKVKSADISTARGAVDAVLDVNSLVNMYIIHEICCDMDIGWSSFFMSLDMSANGNKKLTFEAPWDFDSALGQTVTETDILFAANQYNGACTAGISPNPWLLILVGQDWFWDATADKWNELAVKGIFDNAVGLIHTYSTLYENYYAKNFKKWPNCMGVKHESQLSDVVETFKKQSDAATYLGEWLTARIEFLGETFNAIVFRS